PQRGSQSVSIEVPAGCVECDHYGGAILRAFDNSGCKTNSAVTFTSQEGIRIPAGPGLDDYEMAQFVATVIDENGDQDAEISNEGGHGHLDILIGYNTTHPPEIQSAYDLATRSEPFCDPSLWGTN